MTKDDIRLIYEYDRWANNRVFDAASAQSPDQFTRDLGGSFRSVRDTLVHIIAGEWIWLTYWQVPDPTFRLLTELRERRDAKFHTDAFPDVGAVRLKWIDIEQEQIAFVNRLTDEALGRMLPYRATELSLMHLMQHVANHSTYHRGQISLMMRQLGAEPTATDFHMFLAERRTELAPVRPA